MMTCVDRILAYVQAERTTSDLFDAARDTLRPLLESMKLPPGYRVKDFNFWSRGNDPYTIVEISTPEDIAYTSGKPEIDAELERISADIGIKIEPGKISED